MAFNALEGLTLVKSNDAETPALPKRGDVSDNVFSLQESLVDRGITEVGEIDGAFGAKTEAGIQAFQEQAGLPRTGVVDQGTFDALQQPLSFDEEGRGTVKRMVEPTSVLDTKGETPLGQTQKPFNADLEPLESQVVFSDPQMSFIVALESFREKPYELNSISSIPPLKHKSGLTVANGFDVGQHTEATLRNLGFPQKLIDKFGDWVNLNPDTIVDPDYNVAASGLTLTNIQEIVGVPPDGVYGPATERAIRVYLEDNNQPASRLGEEAMLRGVRRVRGHKAMSDTFRLAKTEGVLPSFSLAELEDISTKSWESLGMDAAKDRYGAGFEDLPEDVQAVLASEAYVMGSGNMTQTALDRARSGQSAADVVAAMPDLHGRKSRVETWLANNSFSDERVMSDQGLQIMTNRLMDSLGLAGDRLAVDAQIGPSSRRTIDRLLVDQGKIREGQSIGTARRKELIHDLYYESNILPPTPTEDQ